MTPNEQLYKTMCGLNEKFDPNYAFAEIGTDEGTSAFWTLKALDKKKTGRWFHTIDPYGGKPYSAGDNITTAFGYDNPRYRKAVAALHPFAALREMNYCHWRLTSLDFFKMAEFAKFWSEGKEMEWKFCYAFLDGDHNWNPVLEEFDWFYDRMPSGAVIVIDDWNYLGDKDSVLARLKNHNNLKYKGTFELFDNDLNYRVYFTKD